MSGDTQLEDMPTPEDSPASSDANMDSSTLTPPVGKLEPTSCMSGKPRELAGKIRLQPKVNANYTCVSKISVVKGLNDENINDAV